MHQVLKKVYVPTGLLELEEAGVILTLRECSTCTRCYTIQRLSEHRVVCTYTKYVEAKVP